MHNPTDATHEGHLRETLTFPRPHRQGNQDPKQSRKTPSALAQGGLLSLLAAPVLALSALPQMASAALVWDGPYVTFTEPAGGSGGIPSNQDRLTSDVWLTRDSTKGLYNAALETGFTAFSSPANTAWASGSLANYASLTYTDWETFNGKNPPSMVGQSAVLHLISDDIYLSVTFTSWGGSAGGFSYQRSTASVPEPSAGVLAGVGLLCLAGLRFGKPQPAYARLRQTRERS